MNQLSTKCRKCGWLLPLLIVFLIVIDQFSKIWVKTNMVMHQDIELFSWWHITYIENPGMAFGITVISKVFLILFRVVLMAVLIGLIVKLYRQKSYPLGFMACFSAIVAGGIGNLTDNIFYSKWFAMGADGFWKFAPSLSDGNYFDGSVVDMLYFPLFSGKFPSWLPILGGEDFLFFRPVFNFADSCVCVGVFCLIIFYTKSLSRLFADKKQKAPKE